MLRNDASARSSVDIKLSVVASPVGGVLSGEQIGNEALGVTCCHEVVPLRPVPLGGICARSGRYKRPMSWRASLHEFRCFLGTARLR
jgi:hypothetical protein